MTPARRRRRGSLSVLLQGPGPDTRENPCFLALGSDRLWARRVQPDHGSSSRVRRSLRSIDTYRSRLREQWAQSGSSKLSLGFVVILLALQTSCVTAPPEPKRGAIQEIPRASTPQIMPVFEELAPAPEPQESPRAAAPVPAISPAAQLGGRSSAVEVLRGSQRSTRHAENISPLVRVTRAEAGSALPTEPVLSYEPETLQHLIQQLVDEWEPLRTQDESQLSDAQRLTKQAIEKRLLGLYFFTGRDFEYLPRLLESVKNPRYPGDVHTLLRAALYDDVGSEELRDQALELLQRPAQVAQFGLAALELCKRVNDDGTFVRHEQYSFRANDSLRIYGELENLSAISTPEGWLSKVQLTVILTDMDGSQKDRRRLGREGVLKDLSPRQRDHNFFAQIYQLPTMIKPGSYRLIVVATDLQRPTQAISQRDLTIEITD